MYANNDFMRVFTNVMHKDTDSEQQPGDIVFQAKAVGRKPDMNGKRATFNKDSRFA